jgi:hypothetical protein
MGSSVVDHLAEYKDIPARTRSTPYYLHAAAEPRQIAGGILGACQSETRPPG